MGVPGCGKSQAFRLSVLDSLGDIGKDIKCTQSLVITYHFILDLWGLNPDSL